MWAKLTGFLSVVVGGLLLLLKIKSAETAKLKHEKIVRERIKEIKDIQDDAERKILKEEKVRINENVNKAIPDTDNTSKRDRLNSL